MPSRERITYPTKQEKKEIIDSKKCLIYGSMGYVIVSWRVVQPGLNRKCGYTGGIPHPRCKWKIPICSFWWPGPAINKPSRTSLDLWAGDTPKGYNLVISIPWCPAPSCDQLRCGEVVHRSVGSVGESSPSNRGLIRWFFQASKWTTKRRMMECLTAGLIYIYDHKQYLI